MTTTRTTRLTLTLLGCLLGLSAASAGPPPPGPGTAVVTDFGADPTGMTDSSQSIQDAVDSLPPEGGTVFFPPGTYLVEAVDPTVESPAIAARITTDNVHVRGIGRPTIRMVGVGPTPDYLNTLVDPQNGGGFDVFTVFSFENVNNGSVADLHIAGLWDGTGKLNYASPRAKGIGFNGGDGLSVSNVTGEGIMGNLVNARGSSTQHCRNVRVENCRAVRCLENGFNFMGGTKYGVFVGNISRENGGDGFEAATDDLVCSDNLFVGNRYAGAGLGGSNTVFSGNVSVGNGFGDPLLYPPPAGMGVFLSRTSVTSSRNALITGNVFAGNAAAGILVSAGFAGATISDNRFRSNGQESGGGTFEIYAVGSSDLEIEDLTISDNVMEDELEERPDPSYAMNLSWVNGAAIEGNTVDTSHPLSIVVQGSCTDVRAVRNRTAHGVSVSLAAKGSFASPQWTHPSEEQGPFEIGEIVYRTDPLPGGTIGWVYTSGGWKAFGAIAPSSSGQPAPQKTEPVTGLGESPGPFQDLQQQGR